MSEKPEKMDLGELAYFAERFRLRLYDAVIRQAKLSSNTTVMSNVYVWNPKDAAYLAARLGISKRKAGNLLASPSLWTLADVSNLLRVYGDAELEFTVKSNVVLRSRATTPATEGE